MLPHSFSTFAHWEPLVFFRAAPQPASPHPSVLHRAHFNRWKTLHLSLLNFLKFCHPISLCPWGPSNGSSALQWVSHSPEFVFFPEAIDIICTIMQVTDDQGHPAFWLPGRNRELKDASVTVIFSVESKMSYPACEVRKSMIILLSGRGCKLNRHSWERTGEKLKHGDI